MDAYIPEIEQNIPLPPNAKEAFPELTPQEELNMRANVVALMSELSGQPILPQTGDIEDAKKLAIQMASDPKFRPEFNQYPNETLAMLAGMVAQMNVSIVDELSDLKTYVVNNLIHSVEAAKDVKTKVAALRVLGEVDGVDAFKKRTEMTVKVQSMAEVEAELLTLLDDVETKYIDVEAKNIVEKDKNDE